MKLAIPSLAVLFVLWRLLAMAQTADFHVPKEVQAGSAFSITTTGTGSASLYIVGPGGAVARSVQLGQEVAFGPENLHRAGHYVAILTAGSTVQSAQFDVVASTDPAKLSFLAKPSRLPVSLPGSISGVAYVFDVFGNLILQPQPVSFTLTDKAGRSQSRTATTNNGVAWVKMDSDAKAGIAQFQASAADVRELRVIQEVAGDPCSIRMTARPAPDKRILLETEPVRDCNGNPVPDGTIVTFTAQHGGTQSTIDVPLKRDVARAELPAQQGAVISVATGVVLGNEIHWSGGE